MKKLLVFACLFVAAANYAQSISGKITNENQQKIGYAEIVATKDKERAATIADADGDFALPLKSNGHYKLEIFVDAEKVSTEEMEVQGDVKKNFSVKLISAPTNPTGEQKIEGVTLTAKKKIFERKVDRLVYNVENSVASQGVDGVEALSKTPMLRVKDDAISIAGKSNVSVLVNDRPLNLSGSDLTNYLKSLRSDDIQKIEVITTPPAKYAAEGSSGLINIVLKKDTRLGWNGTLRTSSRVGKRLSFNNGATLNYQGKRLSMSLNTGIGKYNGLGKDYDVSNGENYLWNRTNDNTYNFMYGFANIKSEYKISEKQTAGIGFSINPSKNQNQEDSFTQTLINGIRNDFASNVDNRGHYRNINTNGFYEIKLDSLGSKLNISGNYMKNKMDGDNHTSTYGTTNVFSNTLNNSIYKIINGQIDLEKNFEKLKTEAGLKYAQINNDADLGFYDIVNGNSSYNPSRSNSFQYDEQNYAAYLSASYKISEKWDSKLGLRYEYTTTEGYSPQYNQRDKNRYGKLFPTVYVSYKPSDDHALSLNYSRRIQRPNFWSLNPFRFYASEYEYFGGNPYLKPAFTDNLELSYTLKNNFTTSLYAASTKDQIDQIQKLENGTRYSIPENFYDEKRAGINMNYNFTKFKWLESNLSAGGYYTKSSSHDETVIPQEGLGANLNMDNNFFLNKAKTVTYVLGFYLDAPSKNGISQNRGYAYFYSGLKLNLMEKNLMINFMVNDLFDSSNWRGKEFYRDYTREYSYRNYQQSLNLSVTYKFGNQNVMGATKQIRNEEESRSGGGGQGGR